MRKNIKKILQKLLHISLDKSFTLLLRKKIFYLQDRKFWVTLGKHFHKHICAKRKGFKKLDFIVSNDKKVCVKIAYIDDIR